MIQELNFPGYVDWLRKRREKVLFPELKPDRDGKVSDGVSDWFTSHKKKLGMPSRVKVFNSFRHTIANLCKVKGIDTVMVKEVIGHDVDDITDYYAEPFPPNITKRDVIDHISFGIEDELKRFKNYRFVKK